MERSSMDNKSYKFLEIAIYPSVSVALVPGYRDNLSRPENWQPARKLTKRAHIALILKKIPWDL